MTSTTRLALTVLWSAALAAGSLPAVAQELPPEGFLCCNLRSDGSWASDANYQESGKQIVPAGTPVKPLSWGRYRINVQMGTTQQAIGNDYSRNLPMDQFANRWIVTQDPKIEIAKWPEKVQHAVKTARVMPGMTRQQVFTAIGHPMASENPSMDATILRYWLSSFAEFQVVFDERGVVKEIQTDPLTRNIVVLP